MTEVPMEDDIKEELRLIKGTLATMTIQLTRLEAKQLTNQDREETCPMRVVISRASNNVERLKYLEHDVEALKLLPAEIKSLRDSVDSQKTEMGHLKDAVENLKTANWKLLLMLVASGVLSISGAELVSKLLGG